MLVICGIYSVLYQALNSSSRSGATCSQTPNNPMGGLSVIAVPPLLSLTLTFSRWESSPGALRCVIGVLFDVPLGQITAPYARTATAKAEIDTDDDLGLAEITPQGLQVTLHRSA